MRPSLGLGTTLALQDAVALAQALKKIDLNNSTAVAATYKLRTGKNCPHRSPTK
ncbi:hypothetical protein [Pleurocapsa sp. FMAR1]|uniref:hypothetical protein n=1 Tax=Pleurocapsa sp. FMAR1 TaxID=3040204 RepID=UPI0039AFCE21